MQCVQGWHLHPRLNFPKSNRRDFLQYTKNGVKVEQGFTYLHRLYCRPHRKRYPAVAEATLGSQNKNIPEQPDEEMQSPEWPDESSFEHDPEVADILMGTFDDPEKMRKRIEDRVRKKRQHILQPKTGSSVPMKVIFNKFVRGFQILGDDLCSSKEIQGLVCFDFSDSYIWIEFYRAPLKKDIDFIAGTIRSWYVLGRLGGYNSMNMQLTQLPIDAKPSYDSVNASNAMLHAFYNIGDLEVQDSLARFWVDVGTSDTLPLDILINALTSLSSDYIGIKHLVFGGKHWGNWKEGMTSVEAGYKVCKI